MKRTILTLSLALATIFASAQTDSLSMSERNHQLQEVVVKSDVARTSAEKSTYLPTRKQRNAATDAIALLQHMMIPQLSIDPMTEAVKTIANEDVAIFVDYLPATKEDLQGMNTQDVKRVEIYDFPKDVRFQNKPHVVNFVMQKYEFGGYTKLTNTEMILADFTTINSVYSKLAHKNWTFDANVSYSFFGQKHIGNESEETFKLPAETIHRTEISENGRQDKGITSASLRATYNTEKIQLANRLELLDNNTMRQDIYGSVAYQPEMFSSSNSASHLTSHEVTPTFTGDWYFELPRQWEMAISPQFQYTRNRQSRQYSEGESTNILNDISEKISSLNWTVGLGKTFAEKHSLSLSNYGLSYNSRLDYKGSTVLANDVNIFVVGQGVEYEYSVEKFTATAELTGAYISNKVNGQTQDSFFPILNLEGRFSPNKHHALSLFFNYNTSNERGSQRNPSIMQEHALLYYCGNPALENIRQLNAMLQYTWMPTNKFTATAFLQHYLYHKYFAYEYTPHNDGTALLRRLENAGDANITYLGANMTLRLLDGKLQFSAYPKLSLYNISGLYINKKTTFLIDLRASCYVSQFNFMAGISNPNETYSRSSAAWQRDRLSSYLIAGWGNARWKARLEYVNPLRTDWRATKRTITTPLYTRTSTALNNNAHQHLTFTLTYTFNYGKKVKQGNELGTATGGQSSIL